MALKRKQHSLSETFMAKATNTSKRYISKELCKLIDLKVITVIKEPTYTESRIISFNKNYNLWSDSRTTVPQANNSSTVELKQHTTVEPEFTTTDELEFHQENKIKTKLKQGDFLNFINSYTENEKLKETIIEFLKYRKMNKKPFKTEYAMKLFLKELDKHDNKIEVIEQSILNNWQGIFAVKKQQQEQTKPKKQGRTGVDDDVPNPKRRYDY